jgi:hypothetical protein
MSRDMHLSRRHVVAFDGVVQTIPGSTTLLTADQMDDLHWFFRGFHTKGCAAGAASFLFLSLGSPICSALFFKLISKNNEFLYLYYRMLRHY